VGGEEWAYQLGAGAKFVGGGISLYWLYRILVFACNFLAGRHDARQQRLEALDARLDVSLGKRLDHLERAERQHQERIQVLEGWLAAMASELRSIDPENPRLKELADALRQGLPIPPPDRSLDDLLQHATQRVERQGKKR
jgi:hypothetical protein